MAMKEAGQFTAAPFLLPTTLPNTPAMCKAKAHVQFLLHAVYSSRV